MEQLGAPERVALCIGLPHAPEAPGLARREVLGTFGHRLPERTLEDLLVVVSELVTNAVRHGGSGIGPGLALALEVDAHRMRVTAMDGGAGQRALAGSCAVRPARVRKRTSAPSSMEPKAIFAERGKGLHSPWKAPIAPYGTGMWSGMKSI